MFTSIKYLSKSMAPHNKKTFKVFWHFYIITVYVYVCVCVPFKRGKHKKCSHSSSILSNSEF